MEGCVKYTRKVHSNYCSNVERERRRTEVLRGESTLWRRGTCTARECHQMTTSAHTGPILRWFEQQNPNPTIGDMLLYARIYQVPPFVVSDALLREPPREVTDYVENQYEVSRLAHQKMESYSPRNLVILYAVVAHERCGHAELTDGGWASVVGAT